jgi:integrase
MVLTPTEMAAIAKCEIKEPLMRYCRDMYCLIFLLIGMNPIDLFNSKGLTGGRLYYKRHKGKRDYSIKVPPQALALINRHRGKNHLIDVMERYSDYRTAAKRVNYKLKDIAEMLEIKKSISIYSARHSWSGYARYLGVSKDDIAAALGHKSIELPTVTEFYEDIGEEQRRVDQANKKVIRLILETKYQPKPLPRGKDSE